jgi:hypothetical protein
MDSRLSVASTHHVVANPATTLSSAVPNDVILRAASPAFVTRPSRQPEGSIAGPYKSVAGAHGRPAYGR